jgi:dihydrofolate reductase
VLIPRSVNSVLPVWNYQEHGEELIMRKVKVSVATSLDNHIARLDGAYDWIVWSEESASFLKEFWKTVDTVVMGRKTYEVALKHGDDSNPQPGVKTYVFSRTLRERQAKNAEIIGTDAAAFVQELKNQDGQDIFAMGGGELLKSLFEANLIEELVLVIHPVLLGSGIPLFHEMKQQINLELIECKSRPNGCVLVSYRVKH